MMSLGNKKVISARQAAYEGLFKIFEKEAYANLTMQQILSHYEWNGEERRFLTELVYGVCRRYNYLLWVFEKLSRKPLEKIDSPIRILGCLGLYQLIFLSSVPESAAVNETVKIAKKVTHKGGVGFINAVLRGYLRQKEGFAIPPVKEGAVLHESLVYNEPEWLIRRWMNEWGKEKTCAVLAAFNTIAPLDIRCNTIRTTTQDLMEKLETLGCKPSMIPFFPEGISLAVPGPFFQSDLMKKGYAYVQNRASMFPALLLAPEKGDNVLDMCAAPGSKTTYLAAMMADSGRIDAWDMYSHKIRLIQENSRRLGITSIQAAVQDASALHPSAFEQYDRVLLDAPCSGLGVLRRKTELRWRRKESDLSSFPSVQEQMLHCASFYVRRGGFLVYSTCTLNREENENVIEDFLSRHSDFSLVPFQLPGFDGKTGWCTLWPDVYDCDGFFAAKLKRREL